MTVSCYICWKNLSLYQTRPKTGWLRRSFVDLCNGRSVNLTIEWRSWYLSETFCLPTVPIFRASMLSQFRTNQADLSTVLLSIVTNCCSFQVCVFMKPTSAEPKSKRGKSIHQGPKVKNPKTSSCLGKPSWLVVYHILVGGWYAYPSEKWWSKVSCDDDSSQLNGKS